MNPKNSEAPLPAPDINPGEQLGVPSQETGEKPVTPEMVTAPKQPVTTTTLQSTDDLMSQVAESHTKAPNAAIPTTNNVVNNLPDDGDLIEKEWVEKAKQIVEKNRDDPYKQSEELTVFKADYMKKRYNKDIKVDK